MMGMGMGMPGMSGMMGGVASGGGGGDVGGCAPLYLIFARGTTEIQGTFGIVGQPLCSGLKAQIPGTRCYDTVYTSDAEYMVSPGVGARTASTYMQGIAGRCPQTKFVLGGYSKGAMVVHQISAGGGVGAKVIGAVTFGDPLRGEMVPTTRTWKTFCAFGDPVCLNGMNVMAHLSYPMRDVGTAVQFLVQAYRASGGATSTRTSSSSGGGAGGGGLGGGIPGLGSGLLGGGIPGLGGGLLGGGIPGMGGGGLGGLGGLGGGGLMSGLGGGGLGLKKRSSRSISHANQHHHLHSFHHRRHHHDDSHNSPPR